MQSEKDASSHEGAAPASGPEYQVSTGAEQGVSREKQRNGKGGGQEKQKIKKATKR